jgi:hypothetical protein
MLFSIKKSTAYYACSQTEYDEVQPMIAKGPYFKLKVSECCTLLIPHEAHKSPWFANDCIY